MLLQIGMWTFSSFGLFQSKGLKAMQVGVRQYCLARHKPLGQLGFSCSIAASQKASVLLHFRSIKPAQDKADSVRSSTGRVDDCLLQITASNL